MARILRQLFLHAHRETTRYVEIQQPHPIFAAASTKARTPPSHLSFDMQERDGAYSPVSASERGFFNLRGKSNTLMASV